MHAVLWLITSTYIEGRDYFFYLFRLFNAKEIFVEEQLLYSLSSSSDDKWG